MAELARGYDFIVVGGGTAGCVLASRLSDTPSTRVLLIEAGPPDRKFLFTVPGASFMVFADPRNSWGYLTEPQPGMGGRALPLIQAKVLGGGSTINGLVCTRGAASTFDSWRDMGCEGWSYDEVLPYFRRVEGSDRGEGPFHGAHGPLKTVRGNSDLPITERMLAAFAEVGIPRVDDLNVAVPDGVGYYDWCVTNGRRASMPVVLPGLRHDRSNLTVVTDAFVTRVVIEGDRAVAVEVVRDGSASMVRAEREIALCAGAIGSTKLLLLSGIGPADELRALQIPVIADLPRVGKDLMNHITYRIEYLCSEPITARRYVHPWRGLVELSRYVFTHTGFLAGGASPAGGFIRSNDELPAPDIQVFASPAILDRKPGFGMRPKIHGYSLSFNQGTPYSRGTVSLRSADPMTAPVIDPRYLDDPRDLEITVRAAERLRAVAAAPSLAKVSSKELLPGPGVRTPAEWAKDISANAGNHYHVCGTCRMGRSMADSVTDSRLRVHGLKGLRVADAGVMPLLMNGNTGAAVVMIADRAADFMSKDG
jgi:choline dehydrogenase